MADPLKIGLKYCGGCNPEYDRKALVDAFVQKTGGRVIFVRPDTPGLSGLLVIAGCRTACVEFDPGHGLPVWVVTDALTGETALNGIQQLTGVRG